MAHVKNFGLVAQLRSDASNHVIRYRDGRVRRSGRGLVFWFRPAAASIAELPMDDREMAIFVQGRTQDFQALGVQGVLTWRVTDPERLAARVDFSIGLVTGRWQVEPVQRVETRLAGLINQVLLRHVAGAPVGALLEAGPEPLRRALETALTDDASLADMGVAAVAVRLTNLAPSSELERALRTPTFEALQQRADQAVFERRALAVEGERAIADNELANRTELARREKQLIAEEAGNARARAAGAAEAAALEANADAGRIRAVEGARAEAEGARVALYRDLAPPVLLGLAARELAGKLTSVEHLNVTPDLLASVLGEFRRERAAAAER